jgi:hypothetical protein
LSLGQRGGMSESRTSAIQAALIICGLGLLLGGLSAYSFFVTWKYESPKAALGTLCGAGIFAFGLLKLFIAFKEKDDADND